MSCLLCEIGSVTDRADVILLTKMKLLMKLQILKFRKIFGTSCARKTLGARVRLEVQLEICHWTKGLAALGTWVSLRSGLGQFLSPVFFVFFDGHFDFCSSGRGWFLDLTLKTVITLVLGLWHVGYVVLKPWGWYRHLGWLKTWKQIRLVEYFSL